MEAALLSWQGPHQQMQAASQRSAPQHPLGLRLGFSWCQTLPLYAPSPRLHS